MAQAVKPVPDHLHTITPRLVVRDATAAIAFYGAAFGAAQIDRPHHDPSGAVVHAEIRIGDSVVYLTEEGADGRDAVVPSSAGGRVTAIMATRLDITAT